MTQTDIANRFISAACDKIHLKDVDFLLGHQTHLKDYNKRQMFIGLVTKEMDSVANNQFYASLKLNTDILKEEIKDQEQAITLYKEMRRLELAVEQTNLEKIQPVEASYGIEQDPEFIVKQGLAHQLATYDRIKAETGYSKHTILATFKKLKLGSNAEIAKFHFDLKQEAKQQTFSLGSDLEMGLKMEVAKAVD